MAVTIGDPNAVLKDLTIIAEDTVAQTRPQLHPLICSQVPEDGAYTKVTVAANVPFPTKFEAERKVMGKDIPVTIQYDQDTYELTIDLNSDLVKNGKAYAFSDIVREAVMSAVMFPDYSASQLVINGGSALGYDGVAFYGTTHKYAKTGSNTIDNTVAKTGQSVPQLAADFASALTKIRTFKDNNGRILNNIGGSGAGKLLIHCPAALEQAFRTMLFGSQIPITVPITTSGTLAASGSNMLTSMAGLYPDGYLDGTSATTWYLHYTEMPIKPFVFIENYPVEVRVLGFGTEFETNFNKVRIALKQRFVLGYHRFDRSVRVA